MNIIKWMNDKVAYRQYKGQAGNGKKIYEESVISSRVELKDEITTNPAGEITAGKGSIYTMNKINNGDKFEYEGTEYEIVKVNQYKEKSGRISHYEGVFK